MTSITNLISPTSRKYLALFTTLFTHPIAFWTGGSIKLRSLDPFESPIVDPNFLSTDFDIKAMVAAVKVAKRFITAKAWQGFIVAPWEPLASANTDEEIAQYARNYASTCVEPLDRFPLP